MMGTWIFGFIAGVVSGLMLAPVILKREYRKSIREFNDYCDKLREEQRAYYRKLGDETMDRIRRESQANLQRFNQILSGRMP